MIQYMENIVQVGSKGLKPSHSLSALASSPCEAANGASQPWFTRTLWGVKKASARAWEKAKASNTLNLFIVSLAQLLFTVNLEFSLLCCSLETCKIEMTLKISLDIYHRCLTQSTRWVAALRLRVASPVILLLLCSASDPWAGGVVGEGVGGGGRTIIQERVVGLAYDWRECYRI